MTRPQDCGCGGTGADAQVSEACDGDIVEVQVPHPHQVIQIIGRALLVSFHLYGTSSAMPEKLSRNPLGAFWPIRVQK